MNNQKKSQHLTIGLALLASLMLASCGGKQEEAGTGANESPAASTAKPAGAASTAKPGTGGAGSTSTTSANSGTKVALSPEAEKLGVKPQGETACPSSAPVKGLVTQKRGNIYRAPKSLDFDKAKPNICFKDTATAEKAGFKAPK
jgi:hypothetical protein